MEKKSIEVIQTYEFDERYYQYIDQDGIKQYAPSVTYILSEAYPTEYGLIKWTGDVGNERAEQIRDEAGDIGSFVHNAISQLLNGEKVSSEVISARFKPKSSLKVKRCIQAFLDWYQKYNPEIISHEYIVWHEKRGFAGTVDLKCKIDGQLYIIDYKTSKTIKDPHRVQVCGYCLVEDGYKAIPAILHLGNTTKKRYSFLEIDLEKKRKYTKQFLLAHQMFQSKYPNAKPSDETYPDKFTLPKKKKQKKKKVEGKKKKGGRKK